MKRRDRVGLALLAAVLPAVAAGAESLRDALAFAYQTNPSLLAARDSLRGRDELVPQALANWRPTVRVTGDAGRAQMDSNIVPPAQQWLKPRDYGLTVTEPLYRGGRTVAQTAQAEAEVGSARAELAATEQAVLLNVVSAYLDVQESREVVALERDNERILQHQLDSVRAQVGLGQVTATDIAQARSAVLGARAALIEAQGGADTAVAAYQAVVGRPPGALEEAGPATGLPSSLEEATRLAAESSPSVLARKLASEAAEHGVDLAEGAFLPQLSLEGGVNRALDEVSAGSAMIDRQVLLNLTVPIYQQGLEYSRLRQEKAVAGQQRKLLDEARRDAIRRARSAWAGLASAKGQVANLTEQIAAGELALDGRQKQFAVGVSTEIDILQTQRDLVAARVDLARARHDLVLAGFQLKGAVGDLNAGALGLPVALYDPAENYREVRDSWFGADAGSGRQEAVNR